MAPALSGVAAGNALVLHVSSLSLTSGYMATTVADSAGGTWRRGPTVARTGGGCESWYCINAAAGTHTLTVTTPSGTNGCELQEFSGVAAIQPIIDTSVTNSGSAASITASLTPGNLNELITFNTFSTNAQTSPPSAPYTNRNGPTNSATIQASNAYVSGNALVGAYAPTWAQSSSNFGCVALALKGATPTGELDLNFVNETHEQGVGVLSGCVLAPNTNADYNYQVSAGTVLLNWGQVAVSAVTAQAVTTANGSNPRYDLVYVNQAGAIVYLAGTAAASPTVPTPPVNCVPLGIINIPASATVLANDSNAAHAHVVDKRTLVNFSTQLAADYSQLPATVLATTLPRRLVAGAGASTVQGRIWMTSIYLPAGMTIGHINFYSGSTAASTPSHWWFGLWDSSLNMLALTADQLTTAAAANSRFSLAIATTAQGTQPTFTTTYSGLHYVGFMMSGTTSCSLSGNSIFNGTPSNQTPIIQASSGTGQTTPPAFPAVAGSLTFQPVMVYAEVAT